jgi:hypothetical protein
MDRYDSDYWRDWWRRLGKRRRNYHGCPQLQYWSRIESVFCPPGIGELLLCLSSNHYKAAATVTSGTKYHYEFIPRQDGFTELSISINPWSTDDVNHAQRAIAAWIVHSSLGDKTVLVDSNSTKKKRRKR